jgi:hypothetical protein
VTPSDPQSLNRYAYVENEPLGFIDPMGLWVWNIGGCYFDTVSASVDVGDGPEFQGYDTQALGCVQAGLGPTLSQMGGNQQSQNYTPTVDCSSPPPMPPTPANASIDQNEQAAQNNGTAWWLSQVQPGGNQDWFRGGQNPQFQSFGNVNYGATCNALGNSLEFCQRGAGAAAYYTATKNALTGQPGNVGPGNPVTGVPGNDNGMPVYGDQLGGMENQSVIAGYGYAQWQKACQSQ